LRSQSRPRRFNSEALGPPPLREELSPARLLVV
jgi:hypothetical protein